MSLQTAPSLIPVIVPLVVVVSIYLRDALGRAPWWWSWIAGTGLVVGLTLVAAAGELLALVVGLELASVPAYILLYFGRRDAVGQAGTVGYFLMNALASAMVLYGLATLFGLTGHGRLAEIHAALPEATLAAAGDGALVKVALGAILAGLGLKIAAPPFHCYLPGLCCQTTHTGAAVLIVVPKAAGMVLLVRIAAAIVPGPSGAGLHAWQVVIVWAALTMTLGNVMAFRGNHLRRLIAHASIAHAGYMLVGLAAGLVAEDEAGRCGGLVALLFHLCTFAMAVIGILAALRYLGPRERGRRDRQIEAVEELAGLGHTRPMTGGAIAVFTLSLVGVPPLAGFWSKLALLGSALFVQPAGGALHPWFVGLALIAALNAALAAGYWLRIVAAIYFRTPLATPRGEGGPLALAVMGGCAVLVVLIGLRPGLLLERLLAAFGGPLP